MAIRDFAVGGMRGLRHAEAHNLGNLVVIAGPNGSGKSSLLDLLRSQRHSLPEPGTEVMFVGPHRTWRASQINRVSAYGFTASSYSELLKSDAMPSFQYVVPNGLQYLQGQARQSSSADDVQAFVKTSLVRLRDRQQTLVTEAWQEQGEQVQPGTVPKLFDPFIRLIRTLLPHLEWVGVVEHDPNNIQCLFRAAGTSGPDFDIDELSSGEKAAVALLLPFVERQAEQLITPAPVAPGVVPLTMLLDEVEIHLHPLLQLQVLEYLRQLAAEGAAQFILTTHSTTLLDALSDDELWLLSPASLRPDNQLSRLTTNQERLEVARTLTGSTHLLTRAKPIVFVEGEPERPGVTSDARLTTLLLPETRSWALVPSRSKRDVTEAVGRLRQQGLDLPGMPVFGLVDADRDQPPVDDHVIPWPVAMIENLLLDSEAIHRALQVFGNIAATSPTAVAESLERAARGRVEDEVRMRIQRHLPVGRLELAPDRFADAEQAAKEQADRWLQRVVTLDLEKLSEAARQEVEDILAQGTQLERFHGKRILRAIYDELGVKRTGLSVPAFQFIVADRVIGTERLQRLTRPAISQIQLYFPAQLGEAIRESGGVPPHDLAQQCDEHRIAWAKGTPSGHDREALRQSVFAYAGTLDADVRRRLVALASQIGTP